MFKKATQEKSIYKCYLDIGFASLIVIQVLGIIYKIKTTIKARTKVRTIEPIVEFKIDITKWIEDGVVHE